MSAYNYIDSYSKYGDYYNTYENAYAYNKDYSYAYDYAYVSDYTKDYSYAQDYTYGKSELYNYYSGQADSSISMGLAANLAICALIGVPLYSFFNVKHVQNTSG